MACLPQRYVSRIMILLSLIFFFTECRELTNYKFPVYTTSSCPRNEFEYQVRSMKMNCTKINLYVCVPNENLTYLCEFCYADPVASTPGICSYLDNNSIVKSYDCSHFINGCPDDWHFSHSVYEYPKCSEIKNGCFLADPSCIKRRTSTDSNTKTNVGFIVFVTLAIISISVCAFLVVKEIQQKLLYGKELFSAVFQRRRRNEGIEMNPMPAMIDDDSSN